MFSQAERLATVVNPVAGYDASVHLGFSIFSLVPLRLSEAYCIADNVNHSQVGCLSFEQARDQYHPLLVLHDSFSP
jgi:hypothetical protein